MSLSLDGVDDNLAYTALNLGTSHSVLFWMNYKDSGDGVLVGGVNGNYTPYIDGAGASSNIYYSAQGQIVNVIHGGFTSGIYYFMSIIRSDTTLKFYKNLVQIGSTQTLGANATLTVSRIGTYENGSFPTNMDISHILFYDRAISTDEMGQLMRFPGSIPNGLLRYWPCLGGSPTPDFSSNADHAVISGATLGSIDPPVGGMFLPEWFDDETFVEIPPPPPPPTPRLASKNRLLMGVGV